MQKQIVKVNALSYAHLIRLLMDGDYNCTELAEETGLHYVTVLHYTRELYKVKAIHIARWEPDCRGRHLIKVYKIGTAKDIKRPRMTRAERQQRARAKKKAMQLIGRMATYSSPTAQLV